MSTRVDGWVLYRRIVSQCGPVLTAVDELLDHREGVGRRDELIDAVGRTAFDNEVRRGHLRRIFPRVYARPWTVDVETARRRAAVLSVGDGSALSHRTALHHLQLPCPGPEPVIHVSVPWPHNPRPAEDGLKVHHIESPFPAVELIDGVPTVSAAAAITTSWPWLRADDQRAPFLAAARAGLTTPELVRRELRRSTRLRGRRQLLELAALIEGGCESELEIWGYLDVFNIPGLDHARRQRIVHIGSRTFRLDLAYETERLAVELDGRKYHSSPAQWERDIERDLTLATAGWQTVRLSHSRLTGDVPGCRRQVLQVLKARRQIRGRS